ncbi:hypothetical protein ACFPRA_06990 [Sporosarcina soli]|uniref:Methyl-accepting chemotaxis protein n=1 Tax=Sporosarcina soli TaxID=334736 RepID=A0ABW0TI80_9BACL
MSDEIKKSRETGMKVNELSVGIENLSELVDLFQKAIDQTEQLQKTITQINEFRVNVKAK